MKKFIKKITESMLGSFIPKETSEELIVKEINDSLKDLDFYGSECDKKNMREDVAAFNKDFNKAIKDSKVEFELAL